MLVAERQIVALPPAECLSMPESQEHALAPMVRRLSLREELSEADRDAILALPFRLRTLAAGQFIVWDGDRPQNSCLLISGYAYRHKDAGNGGRQVMSIHMKGDIVDLQNSLLGTADHNVQMLTTGQVAMIPVESITDLAFRHPKAQAWEQALKAENCITDVRGDVLRLGFAIYQDEGDVDRLLETLGELE